MTLFRLTTTAAVAGLIAIGLFVGAMLGPDRCHTRTVQPVVFVER